jgi:hypothetical protein
MSIRSLLKILLLLCAGLSIAIFFRFRPLTWPSGDESKACMASSIIFLVLLVIFKRYEAPLTGYPWKAGIVFGLAAGLLWTVEILIKNLVQPVLPERDIIENVFWGFVSLLLLARIIAESFRTRTIMPGIKMGLLTGFMSGLVACATALLLVISGMKFMLSDPLKISEWNALRGSTNTNDMSVYIAYKTYAGAILHLYILGTLEGLILGVVGGTIGKWLGFMKSRR